MGWGPSARGFAPLCSAGPRGAKQRAPTSSLQGDPCLAAAGGGGACELPQGSTGGRRDWGLGTGREGTGEESEPEAERAAAEAVARCRGGSGGWRPRKG